MDIDWASLEDHIVEGVFSPPAKEEDRRAIISGTRSRRLRDAALLNPVIPSTLFSHNPTTSTYKTTIRRLRDYPFNTLITLYNVATEERVTYDLRQVVRNGADWRVMKFAASEGRHLFVLNTSDLIREQARIGDEIEVVQDNLQWIAKFRWSDANKREVQRAGFRFNLLEKQWTTCDPKIAAAFDPSIRAKLESQRKSIVNAAPQIRRPIIGNRRWG
jgi:hypothetical protein